MILGYSSVRNQHFLEAIADISYYRILEIEPIISLLQGHFF